MLRVTYVQPDGCLFEVEAAVGDTLLDAALDNGVAGILGQCGGGCTCLTCHCYVEAPWIDRLPAPIADELDLLEYLPEREPSSRIACQVRLSESLDGIVVRVPIRQI